MNGRFMDWSEEQLQVIAHDASRHCRVLAGPGTGKSTTVIALAERIAQESSPHAIRMVTFTRAATTELAAKAVEGSLDVAVTTVHSLALRILLRNPQWIRLPLPLRIPDDWEFDELIHHDIRQRLSAGGWPGIRKTRVEKLEREMAAQWESLDPDLILDSSTDPELRAAFVAAWQRQRRVSGYSLFAEMPWYALEMIDDHPDANLLDIEVLVVDEFQDLNRCEIRLFQTLAERGIVIVAVGDDEQSIYSWRMAAPQGIQTFSDFFPDADDYTLSLSHRCGAVIIDAAQRLIATSPLRIPGRPMVRPSQNNPEGTFAYLRFQGANLEREGVADIIHGLHGDGVPYEEIAILLRTDYQGRWSTPLRAVLENRGIPFSDIESVTEPLKRPAARQVLALARLVLSPEDDLAWWAIFKLESGISDLCVQLIADSAAALDLRFHERLQTLKDDPPDGASATSVRKAVHRYEQILGTLAAIGEEPDLGDDWVAWLASLADTLGVECENELLSLLNQIRESITEEVSRLGDLLGQLEPAARDIALAAGGVRIMTTARSKGLTFDASIAMGVEEQLYPSPTSSDPEEDRRLLYVAMTRAKRFCYLTMARVRYDGTAFSGSGTLDSRSRVDFLSQAGINPVDVWEN
jgi:DNA helicase-2/ATP-dependent DNA helicase PcrA